jgi:cation diffusion facilitator family transporter
VHGAHVHTIGVGIAVIAASAAVNLVVSRIIARRARETASVALAGDATHLSADAFSSLAVLGGLILIALTRDYWIDPVVALLVAGGIVIAGARLLRRASRALVDEALPQADLDAVRQAIREVGGPRGVVGFHKLRSRSAGSRRYVDVHLQFADGTTLEAAHGAAHALTDEIAQRLDGADVLIHIEPGARVEPGTEV